MRPTPAALVLVLSSLVVPTCARANYGMGFHDLRTVMDSCFGKGSPKPDIRPHDLSYHGTRGARSADATGQQQNSAFQDEMEKIWKQRHAAAEASKHLASSSSDLALIKALAEEVASKFDDAGKKQRFIDIVDRASNYDGGRLIGLLEWVASLRKRSVEDVERMTFELIHAEALLRQQDSQLVVDLSEEIYQRSQMFRGEKTPKTMDLKVYDRRTDRYYMVEVKSISSLRRPTYAINHYAQKLAEVTDNGEKLVPSQLAIYASFPETLEENRGKVVEKIDQWGVFSITRNQNGEVVQMQDRVTTAGVSHMRRAVPEQMMPSVEEMEFMNREGPQRNRVVFEDEENEEILRDLWARELNW